MAYKEVRYSSLHYLLLILAIATCSYSNCILTIISNRPRYIYRACEICSITALATPIAAFLIFFNCTRHVQAAGKVFKKLHLQEALSLSKHSSQPYDVAIVICCVLL